MMTTKKTIYFATTLVFSLAMLLVTLQTVLADAEPSQMEQPVVVAPPSLATKIWLIFSPLRQVGLVIVNLYAATGADIEFRTNNGVSQINERKITLTIAIDARIWHIPAKNDISVTLESLARTHA